MDKVRIIKDSTSSPTCIKYFLQKDDPRIQLNFNAIAQGYSCDYIAQKFELMGIENYLIEIGGEIYCKGKNAKGTEWKIGIDKPIDGNNIPGENLECIILLSNKGLVTSGNYRKFYVKEGKKYSHTIDPISGYPVSHSLLSATIVAEDATIADAYATYFMVIGLDKSKEILNSDKSLQAILVYGDGDNDNMKTYSTDLIKLYKNEQ
jgi:Membrane-associated lipoprotein involved in thiamine biosynthesis